MDESKEWFKTKQSATTSMNEWKRNFPKYELSVEKTNRDKINPWETVRTHKGVKYYSGGIKTKIKKKKRRKKFQWLTQQIGGKK